MSSPLPRRVRKTPARLTYVKPTVKPKKVVGTKRRRAPPSNINVNPKSKLLTTLAKLRNEEAPINGLSRTGYTFLASLYRDHPNTQLTKYAFEMSVDQQRAFMQKQHQTLTKKTSLINASSETVTISMNGEKMHDLLIMLWMDMSHDKMFKKESFNEFLTSSIKNEITQKNVPPTQTELVTKFIRYDILKLSNGIITLKSDIELKQKRYMHEIWGDPSHIPKIVKKTASILSIVKDKSKPIYVSYDAENSNYITELIAKTKMNDGTYYLKRVFTIANLMDPGRGAAKSVGGFGRSGGSVNKLINRLFDEKNTSTPFKFNYQMFKFNFGDYFTIEIVPDGSKFNAKINGKMMNMQVKAADAISGNAISKLSKTFGDFIQIITVGHLRKSGINIVSSTQDGGFVGMTGFVHGTLFGIEPALISDSTTVIGTGNVTETGIKFYGLDKYLKYDVEPARSGVTTQQLRNNNNNNNNVNQPSAKRLRPWQPGYRATNNTKTRLKNSTVYKNASPNNQRKALNTIFKGGSLNNAMKLLQPNKVLPMNKNQQIANLQKQMKDLMNQLKEARTPTQKNLTQQKLIKLQRQLQTNMKS